MSDDSDAAVIKELFSNSILSNRVLLSGSVIVFYDYVLTLPAEISEIWRAKRSGAQVLFVMTRYSFIANIMLQYILSFNANPTDSLCRGLYYTSVTSVTFTQIGLLAIFSLRTYAIYQRSLPILVMLCLVGISVVVVSLYDDIPLVTPLADPFGFKFPTSCVYSTDVRYARYRAASQSLILVFDVAVFSLTFARTIHHTMQMRKLKLGNSLGYVILRDGILYFLFQMVIHAAIITIYNIFNQGVDWAGEISVIGNVLVVILTCRLVLNLRQVSHTLELQSTSSGQIGTMTEEPEFATNSILGNLGAPLRIGPEFDDEDEVPIDDQMPLETLDAIPASPHH